MDFKNYRVTLETVEPFRIGALENPLSDVHNPVTRIGGRVVVQGSSLKGALRAEVESYLIQRHRNDAGMKPCIPSPESGLTQAERQLIPNTYKQGGACKYQEPERRGREQPPPRDYEYICPACYLFGAQGITGFVRVPYLFSDAVPEDLYAVRIDRASGTVAERTNRDYQIIAPGVQFVGTFEVLVSDPVRGWQLGRARKLPTQATRGDVWLASNQWSAEKILQEFIVDRLQAIQVMGGFKSKGAGGVKITVTPA
jgi:CRISPR/Cas system CSM-associated protein Csm3 (group 7 of RAMP superfamily)